MKKIIAAGAIALSSVAAHAETFQTSYDCSKAATWSEHAMCEDKDLAAADLAYWKVFQAARNASADKKAFHDHAITAFKYRQQCTDRECVVNWFKEQNAYIASLNSGAPVPVAAPAPAPAAPAAPKDSDDDADNTWYFVSVEHGCTSMEAAIYVLTSKHGIDTPKKYVDALNSIGSNAVLVPGKSADIMLVRQGGDFTGFAKGLLACKLGVATLRARHQEYGD